MLLAHHDSDAKSEEASEIKMEVILLSLLIFSNKEMKPKDLKIHPLCLSVECSKFFTC